jgi:AcrR family transcriptional regulator
MKPDERRRAIVDAVVPLLLEHGRSVTTRQIADAAGIAEGTIFRAFDCKEQIVDAALERAFDPAPLLDDIGRIDADQPLRDRMVDLTRVLQNRFVEIFGLMRAVGLVAPPRHLDADESHSWRAKAHDLMVGLIAPDADRLRVPPEEVMRVLRLLTFSGSHREISDGRLMTPEEIVDVVLHGTRLEVPPAAGRREGRD